MLAVRHAVNHPVRADVGQPAGVQQSAGEAMLPLLPAVLVIRGGGDARRGQIGEIGPLIRRGSDVHPPSEQNGEAQTGFIVNLDRLQPVHRALGKTKAMEAGKLAGMPDISIH